MPIRWNNYLALRNTTAKSYIDDMQIKNYEELLSYIDLKDILPPTREEVSEFFSSQQKAVSVKTEKRKTTKNKPVAKVSSSNIEKPEEKKVDISQRKPRSTRRSRAKKPLPKS